MMCSKTQTSSRMRKIILGSIIGTTSSLSLSTTSSSTSIAGARQLGKSDLIVSEACLGTMTFGVQNTRKDAFAQLNLARSHGVNFIDTAELYPVPLTAKTYRAGATEEIVGEYLSDIGSAARDELVIATKIAGYFPNSPVAAARTVPPTTSDPLPDCRLDAASIKRACDASLRRLKTDRIDLYQIHWPDRYVPVFGKTEFRHDQMRGDSVSIEETASALRDLIDEGKVRAVGLSNESTYGVCEWARITEQLGIRDKLATIQNSYSLVDRRFDSELAEACAQHQIGLLPWSVLAGGLLSGKYRGGAMPEKSRFGEYPEYMQRWSPVSASKATLDAVDEYAMIADKAGLSLAELSIEFIRSRRFVSDNGSVIVGATTVEQLEDNLAPFSHKKPLDDDVMEEINRVHMKCPDPSCSL